MKLIIPIYQCTLVIICIISIAFLSWTKTWNLCTWTRSGRIWTLDWFGKGNLAARTYTTLLTANSRTGQVADWTAHGLNRLRTGQLMDYSSFRLVNWWSGQLVDAAANSSYRLVTSYYISVDILTTSKHSVMRI